MVDFLFYLIYCSVCPPHIKYYNLTIRWSKKDLARSGLSSILSLFFMILSYAILLIIHYLFNLVLISDIKFIISLLIGFITYIVIMVITRKVYTYKKTILIEEIYNKKIKKWQAVILLLFIYVLLFVLILCLVDFG